MYIIQRFFWNNLNNELVNKLYYRIRNGYCINSEKKYIIFSGGYFNTNTYFNSLPTKYIFKNTVIKNIGIHISFEGNGFLKIYGRKNEEKILIEEKNLNSNLNVYMINNIDILKDMEYIYIELITLDKLIIKNLEWITNTKPIREVYLSIICTTFNRQNDVKRLITRLTDNNIIKQKTKLFIINNGDNIDIQNTSYYTIIKNKNTGGTGGFMRGLLESKKNCKFTHAMFIDDDAFCEPLSIDKVITLLEYTIDDNETFAGAMLYLGKPWLQYEAGATLEDFNIKSNNFELDLRNDDSLLKNAINSRCSYGPWWFFIFPLKKDLKMSFPFFVRGDDVTFSLRNNFSPYVLNGVCSWQESFDAKISPTVEYLAFRSFIMIALLYNKVTISKKILFKKILVHLLRELCSFRYPIVKALCQAIRDVMEGPKFWEQHIEMGKYLKQMNNDIGKIDNYKVNDVPTIYEEKVIKKYSKLYNIITCFGHIIPNCFCKKSACVWGLSARPYVATGRKSIEQYCPEKKAIFIFKKNNLEFFKLLIKAIYLSFSLVNKRNYLVKKYVNSLKKFETVNFWEEILK